MQMEQYAEAKLRFLSVIGLVMLLSGCGTLVGAGAGGLVGNQFGKGSGKTAATLGGIAAGGYLGSKL
jgi:outer membrane lipoprotein SlyB